MLLSPETKHKMTRNPAFGLIPMLVFSLLIGRIDVRIAICLALALSVIGFYVARKHSRLIYQLSIITFSISLAASLFVFEPLTDLKKFVVVEVIFVLSLIILRISRAKIVYRLAKRADSTVKSYVDESFRVAFQTQYGLSIHLLFVLLLYVFYTSGSQTIMTLAELLTCQIILVTIILMESARLRILDRKLRNEEWLPIVNEQGAVTGKIAKSVTREKKNQHLHPVVRIALIHNGKLYLQERKPTYVLNPGKLDYPFERYVQFKQEISATVEECVHRTCGNVSIPVRFILKYSFENEQTKRLNLLYVSDIDDENLFNSLKLTDGKLWTQSKIDDNLGTGIFSECFELEYEYLKNTVLLTREIAEENNFRN